LQKLERLLEFDPAYDKRSSDPKINYGIHGVEMRWIVKGEEGAIQFVVYTNWHLSHVANELKGKSHVFYEPLPVDVGYHSKVPRYDGQHPVNEKCKYLNDQPCYYDGSGLHAQKVFNMLVEKGGEAVWEYLENYYAEIFAESVVEERI